MGISDHLTKNIKDLIQIPGLQRITRASHKTGMPPGSLIHVGEKKIEKTVIRLIDYNKDQLNEMIIDSVEQCLPYKNDSSVTWIEIQGLHDVSLIEQIGKSFEIHPLVLEDILNTSQRPKFEEYDNFLFFTLKNLAYDKDKEQVTSEQVSIVAGAGFVISFLENDNPLFEPVRARLRSSKLRIRSRASDYLAYALIDTIVDHTFMVLESLGENLEELDELLLQNPKQDHMQYISDLKRNFLSIRKAVWPLQEIIKNIMDDDYELIDESTLLYFRDVRDHIHQIIDVLETYREAASNAVDTYFSILSMKMNEVMKVLTIAATIFMPLTFIAGIYGMNFKFMPELEWHWGYFTVLGLMIGLIIVMFIYFRRKNWL